MRPSILMRISSQLIFTIHIHICLSYINGGRILIDQE